MLRLVASKGAAAAAASAAANAFGTVSDIFLNNLIDYLLSTFSIVLIYLFNDDLFT